ncbi:hypothetical protein DY124_07860 [Apilactobacillus micheneri]|uniref:hypothetical protein n=1 Tax=Apilactobacillus micheneri TaxID=1899430 RepID=UPI00112C14DD|nr:hypothetical protein [Apilactobacillus micheneri]TPR41954.1 hypothetical protein DY124_07860 [Apilactobacillus micheneri]TPR46989.1 hypothetical protein DY125_07865 [Apilactobacillus micheneri]
MEILEDIYKHSNLKYLDYVKYLKNKYGKVNDDYYKEKSYLKFKNGEIKNPTKGKASKTSEGLFIHHIYEIKYENISNPAFIKTYKYPFKVQKSENLVYCSLLEHSWLHVLIYKETKGQLGYKGLELFLMTMISDWYIEKIIPTKKQWQKNVYKKSFINPKQAKEFLKFINDNMPSYTKEEQKIFNFQKKYPNIVKKGINIKISRERILKKLFKYSEVKSFKNFKSQKINELRENLLSELNKLINNNKK